MDFIAIVTLLVIVMDPVGLTPVVQGLLRGFTPRQKTKILLRELAFALVILLLFLVFGNMMMKFLRLEQATLSISGGVLLFMVALGMVFPALNVMHPPKDAGEGENGRAQDPFIVPIAVPLIAGPSAMAIVLLHSAQATDNTERFILGGALATAWAISSVVLLLSQYILKFLGNRGTLALERLMGMLLILISVQMFIDGLKAYGPIQSAL